MKYAILHPAALLLPLALLLLRSIPAYRMGLSRRLAPLQCISTVRFFIIRAYSCSQITKKSSVPVSVVMMNS